MGALHELVAECLREARSLPLADLLDPARELAALPPVLELGARTRRPAIALELAAEPSAGAGIAVLLADAAREYLQREHQFLHVDAPRERALRAMAQAFVEVALGALTSPAPWPEVAVALRIGVEELRARLRSLAIELLTECGSLAPGSLRAPEVVCAEYSPELQLEVLGVAVGALAAPVLDLGCGSSGSLVHFLRRAGHAPVWGLDRSAPAGEGFLRESWFDRSWPAGVWRTVLSHHAFSLHFLHAHHRSAERAAAFASKYVEILRSLQPGGRFLYAPALPFVEEHLDRQAFAVSLRPIGDSGLHAACVERRA